MTNQLEQILEQWHAKKDQLDWLLATVIETAGSTYRKSGAMMFINSLGQFYGLISGGCLEADLVRHARQCFDSKTAKTVCYDMQEEDDIGWQLGIGCGGMVKLLLQPISTSNNYLQLNLLREHLKNRQTCYYVQDKTQLNFNNSLQLEKPALDSNSNLVVHKVTPVPQLVIFGGGVDALPVCNLAATMGWQVIVIDSRVTHARASQFANATNIVKQEFSELTQEHWLTEADAIVIMTHNIELDAQALAVSQGSNAKFIGLLGPKHRTEKVLKAAELTRQSLAKPLSNPIGINIGGELPEAIALSILAEVQGVLSGKLSLYAPLELQNVS